MTEQPLNRSIRIEKSAVGSAIVSGDGNTIYVIHQTTEQQGVEEVSPSSSTEIGANPYRTHLGSMMKSCRLGFFT